MKYALVLVGCLIGAIPPASAVDGVSVELGTSDSSSVSVDVARVGALWDWSWRWAVGSRWHIGGYWEATAGYWRNDSAKRSSSDIGEFGLTPFLRLQQTDPGGIAPYVEAGIGVHYLTMSSINPDRRLGSRIQFGDQFGVGLRFGPGLAYDLGYRYHHLSNAGIKQPNQGINFHQLRLQYRF